MTRSALEAGARFRMHSNYDKHVINEIKIFYLSQSTNTKVVIKTALQTQFLCSVYAVSVRELVEETKLIIANRWTIQFHSRGFSTPLVE